MVKVQIAELIERVTNNNKRLIETNQSLSEENSELKRFISEYIPHAVNGARPEQADEERPKIHPQLIIKMASGNASSEDMRSAVVLRFIQENPGATIGQVSKATGFSTAEGRFLIQEMRRQSIVRSEGARRGTRYFMSEVEVPGKSPVKTNGAAVKAAVATAPVGTNALVKRRGRPPGSKNKAKSNGAQAVASPTEAPRRRGRPPGSKNRPKEAISASA